jgi:feruloyl-CoA synthase
MKLLTPGLVFADDATKFADALLANVSHGTEIAASRGQVAGRDVTLLSDLQATPEHPRLDAAHDAIGPDTIAKFLLTSGSTGNPKAVINTQRMICANQVMLRETLAFLMDEPPVIVAWPPRNESFRANHNLGLTLFNGGSMYLDEGKPMPGGIEETVRNLREISPTVYFNVPKGYESLLPYLREDSALRAKFFRRLHAMFFSGAALSPFVWNSLDKLAVQETGFRVPMLTGLGATETSPFFMSVRPDTSRSGHVGLPVLGNDAKLLPNNGKLEVRAKGPNVTPGYWRQPELTAKAFDEEGFYCIGDAGLFVDDNDPLQGIIFAGRVVEDFKLTTGTFVHVGSLRTDAIAAATPVVHDALVAGQDRPFIGLLAWPNLHACRQIVGNPDATYEEVVKHPAVVDCLKRGLQAHNASTAGATSMRVARAMLMVEPPSIDGNELTDKGYINQRAGLERRAALVEKLYAENPGEDVVILN